MRRTVRITIGICVLGMLMGPGTAYGQNERGEILKVRESVWRAWFANDAKALERLVPADTIVISSDEAKWKNQADILRTAAEFQADGGKLLRLEFPHRDSEVWRRGDHLDIVPGRDGRKRKARGGYRASNGDICEAQWRMGESGVAYGFFQVRMASVATCADALCDTVCGIAHLRGGAACIVEVTA